MYNTNNDPEELIECPYNKSHMIRAKRMPYHLMKCRQNSTKELAVCPFNARHEVPKPELRHHMANCPDKAVLEKDLAYEVAKQEGTFFKGCTDVPGYDGYNIEISENWEEDVNPRPRIGVPANFRQRIQFQDITGGEPKQSSNGNFRFDPRARPDVFPDESTDVFTDVGVTLTGLRSTLHHYDYRYSTSKKKAFHRNLVPGSEQPRLSQEQAADDINNTTGKLRLPKKASEAYQLTGSQVEEKPSAPPPNIFMYSLALAGVGRGRGGKRQPEGDLPAQTDLFSPYDVMTHMSQVGQGKPPTTATGAAAAASTQLNSISNGASVECFGDELDELLDQELTTRSDTTPEINKELPTKLFIPANSSIHAESVKPRSSNSAYHPMEDELVKMHSLNYTNNSVVGDTVKIESSNSVSSLPAECVNVQTLTVKPDTSPDGQCDGCDRVLFTHPRSLGRGWMGMPHHVLSAVTPSRSGVVGEVQYEGQQYEGQPAQFSERGIGDGDTLVDCQLAQTNRYGIHSKSVQPLAQTNSYTPSGDDDHVSVATPTTTAAVPPPPGFVFPSGPGKGLRAAVGRGRGGKKPGVTKSSSNGCMDNTSRINLNINNNNQYSVLSDQLEMAPDSEKSSGDSGSVCEDVDKLLKRLQKKMRQIENLDAKKKQGTKLTDEEREKLSKKKELEKQMADLQTAQEMKS